MIMDLRVTLVQSELFWKSPEANRSMFEEKLSAFTGETDLVILPEMFTTGFTMDAEEVAEPANFTTERWMKQVASRTGAVLTGSYVVREDKKYFNRLLWVTPSGEVHSYDKRHLFRMADEDQYYNQGNRKLICKIGEWKIALFICYDLRFPVWIRNHYKHDSFDYDLAVFVANWPQPRSNAWEVLLKARAIENSVYVAGVNRTGTDGVDVPYNGGSMVINAKGEVLADLGTDPLIKTVVLDRAELQVYREKFPVQLDADSFSIE